MAATARMTTRTGTRLATRGAGLVAIESLARRPGSTRSWRGA